MHSGDGNSGCERRRSFARRSTQSQDDDYDLTANVVSDGFRPSPFADPIAISPALSSPSRFTSNQFSSLFRPPTAIAPVKGYEDFNRPSSTAKPPRLHDSLTLQNDGLISSRNGQPSPSSSSTQVESQYGGTTQPSHPYQLYTQRTYSNATSSTGPFISVEAYDGPRGPAHPYALYTQNTTTADDPNQSAVPVGFNGMGNEYRRHIGPGGDEAEDLIGPLGHMEELPPYTRYPQEAYVAKSAIGTESPLPCATDVDVNRSIGLAVSSPIEPIPGAGGIGLATRNPEFSATEEDLPSRGHRPESFHSVPSVQSYHEVNGAARDLAEKPTQGKWQRRARKKLWGIVPYWAICLLLFGIVVTGVVMGTVIGTIVTRQRGPPPPKDKLNGPQTLPNNVQFLLERPAGLPSLDTGCYALPPMEKYQVPKACIKDSAQTPAWSCDLPFRWYSMNVTLIPDAKNTADYALKLAPFDPRASRFIWGSQPPDIPEFKTLALAKDLGEISRGPAWYLEVEYNKTVIVPENQLQATATATPTGAAKRYLDGGPLVSRQVSGFDKSRYMRKGFAASEGEKPWICSWPSIKLQVFIYPNQTATPDKTTTSAGSMSTGPSFGPLPSNYKAPYTKLVKFVERRPDSAPPATCTQYTIIDGGYDKTPSHDENGKPITIVINEVVPNAKNTITDRALGSSSWDGSSSLHERRVDLAPCGCVSFSWSV